MYHNVMSSVFNVVFLVKGDVEMLLVQINLKFGFII
jgi:hypothetical protein